MSALFPYQIEGAKFLAEKGRALLADDMGLGKTAQAIQAAKDLGAENIIVVCPASLIDNWKREFNRFWPEFRGCLGVYSYNKAAELVAGSGKTIPGCLSYELTSFDVLILDEAHYLKNRSAKRTQAIFGKRCDGKEGLAALATNVFLLTGTPAPNNPSELWTLLRAVGPDTILGAKTGKPLPYWAFTERYCRIETNYLGHPQIKGGKNLAELKERIAPFVLRRKKEDVLKDLPPIRFDLLPLPGKIELPAEMVGMDKIIREALASKGVEGLKEIAPHVATLRRLTGLYKTEPVVEFVANWLEAGGKKIVLFAQHRDVIEALSAGLLKLGAYPVTVAGSTPPAMRQRAVDIFQTKPACHVFIGQLQAAGTGITLTAASDLIFVESSWVPTENEQAAMRIHRIGQRNACLVRFATIAGSIDEQIQAACARKMDDIKAIFA